MHDLPSAVNVLQYYTNVQPSVRYCFGHSPLFFCFHCPRGMLHYGGNDRFFPLFIYVFTRLIIIHMMMSRPNLSISKVQLCCCCSFEKHNVQWAISSMKFLAKIILICKSSVFRGHNVHIFIFINLRDIC